MDFKTLSAPKEGLAAVAADALLLVVTAAQAPADLPGPLGAALKAAVDAGDLALKAGQQLYLHKVAGVKAARVAVAVAADASVAAWRKALAAGVTLLKAGGTRHLAVALAGGADLSDAHAEALVGVVTDQTYLYRHTKPSAPAAAPAAAAAASPAHRSSAGWRAPRAARYRRCAADRRPPARTRWA